MLRYIISFTKRPTFAITVEGNTCVSGFSSRWDLLTGVLYPSNIIEARQFQSGRRDRRLRLCINRRNCRANTGLLLVNSRPCYCSAKIGIRGVAAAGFPLAAIASMVTIIQAL